MATLLKTNGEKIEVTPKNKTDFQLDELYSLLGVDCIELVFLRIGKLLVVDENALCKEVPPSYNFEASKLYGAPILGDALLCENSQIK